MIFDRFAMVDWSGGNQGPKKPKKDAIWLGIAGQEPEYLRHRQAAEVRLAQMIEDTLAAGQRLMIGFDFPFGYPRGFAEALTGKADPFAVWAWLEARIADAPASNNRFDVAGEINRRFGGAGPFWGNAARHDVAGLPRTKARGYANPFAERRQAETRATGAFTCWQLAYTGAVGSQILMGLPVLARLRRQFAGAVAVWPFEPLTAPIAFVEIWPSLIAPPSAVADPIPDREQVRRVANAVAALPPDQLAAMLDVDAPEEGWIFGLGHEETLSRAAGLAPPPPLRNDCFALPAGVNWTPVRTALDRLKASVRAVTRAETVATTDAAGRILAAPARAPRAHPPFANAAVDGYGFAHDAVAPGTPISLVAGRAAAGAPFDGTVPPGQAVRILTGAPVPGGVDTIVLEEDCTVSAGTITFQAGLKPGANCRPAGEDIDAGARVSAAGTRLTPGDVAVLASVGIGEVSVRARLRVATLSTGDEVVPLGAPASEGQIYDANRPMLSAILNAWGYQVVDLGHVGDDAGAVRAALAKGAAEADAILTTGGASAGDEDHVAAQLRAKGTLNTWRIALKPGRPLALALWDGTPVFGLPGNPVAAFVCTLLFARPALAVLAGGPWHEPVPIPLAADFAKRRKPGREDYLRARRRGDAVEVFASEGSGRVSGLAWADGLVALPDDGRDVARGDIVNYLPFSAFGL